MSKQPFDPKAFQHALTAMASVPAAPEITEARWAYREAAAVRTTFTSARKLSPLAVDGDATAGDELIQDSRRVEGPDGALHWMLDEDIRREALRRLAAEGAISEAIRRNPVQGDVLQRMLERIGRAEPIALADLSFEELAHVLQISSWLQGLIPSLPDENEVEEYLAIAELLTPMRGLTADGFYGRTDILGDLTEQVFAVRSALSNIKFSTFNEAWQGLSDLWFALRDTSRPPLHLYGPGGSGKSTVIARFLLERVDRDPPQLLFVNLDFNRPNLLAHEPLTLLAEMLRQLSVQRPELHETAAELRHAIMKRISRRAYEPGATALQDQRTVVGLTERETYIATLARAIDDVVEPELPLLLLLDTLEEVQYRGQDFIEELWYFLGQLHVRIPRLRVVTAGRAPLQFVDARQVALDELDEESARRLLTPRLGQLQDTPKLAREIIGWVGRNPLTLKLAADVVTDAGADELRAVVRSDGKPGNKRSELVQGLLYRRVLDHLHDDEIRRLALPALALRRLTPAVIQHVLAEPCGVEIADDERAREVFDCFEREVGLVEIARDGSLRFRNDVRRLALRLVDSDPDLPTGEVNRRAVSFYAAQTTTLARAEELYHRLRLGEPRDVLAERWEADLPDLLAGALDDLSGASYSFLATKLGMTLSSDELAGADQRDWEEQAEKRARYFIDLSDGHRALAILRERRDRLSGSRLPLLEASALDLVGKTKAASRLLDAALKEAEARADPATLRVELALASARAKAAMTEPRPARERLGLAGRLAAQAADPVLQLRVLATAEELRLEPTETPVSLDDVLERISPPALASEVPTLCAAAGQFGSRHPELIQLAVETVGLPGLQRDELRQLSAALEDATGRSAAAWRRALDAARGNPSATAEALAGVSLVPSLASAFAKIYRRLSPQSGQLSGPVTDDIRTSHVPSWSNPRSTRRQA